METNIPNLDCMTQDDMMNFWMRHQRGRHAKELCPDGGKGSRTTTSDLACYASNKAAAMSCRLRGDITSALMYEDICDRIYAELPAWARW